MRRPDYSLSVFISALKISDIRVLSFTLKESGGFAYLLLMINAPITPGIQPHRVRINTISNEPQPLSKTARGGKIMQRSTRQIDIYYFIVVDKLSESSARDYQGMKKCNRTE